MRNRCLWILLLTAADIIATAYGIKLGIMQEANPLLAYGMHNHPILTGMCIMALVAGALVIMYRCGEKVKWLPGVTAAILAIKVLVVVYEIYGYAIMI